MYSQRVQHDEKYGDLPITLPSGNVTERAPCPECLGSSHTSVAARNFRRKRWSPVYVLRADNVSRVTRLTRPSGNRRVFKARSLGLGGMALAWYRELA